MTAVRFELVDIFGSAIQKHSERLIISTPNAQSKTPQKRQVPVLHLDHLLIGSKGISISSDAIELCCQRGIPITLLDWSGRPLGRFSTPAVHGTCRTRRAQLQAYHSESGGAFAKQVVIGKCQNQAQNLKYFAKNRKDRNPPMYHTLCSAASHIEHIVRRLEKLPSSSPDQLRPQLMRMEAEASKAYWATLSELYNRKSQFTHREHRQTKNPTNAALNYAYGVLASEIWTASTLAGLEPYAGFLHADRPGRMSFVLDMIEEFRPVVADRVVFAMVAKGWKIDLDDNGWLSHTAKRRLLDNLQDRFDSMEPYKGSRRIKLRSIIQRQCYLAAKHFLGTAEYRPYRQRW